MTADGTPRSTAARAARTTRLVVGAVLLVLLTLIVVANTDKVRVNLLAGTVTLPLIVLLLVVAVLGALIGSIVTLLVRRSH